MREVKKHCQVKAAIPEGSDEQLINFLRSLEVEYAFLPYHRDIKHARGLVKKIKMHAGKIRGERLLLKHLNKHDLRNSVVHIDLAPWQSLFALMYLCRRSGQVFITMHNRIWSPSSLRRALWKLKLHLLARFKNFHILASNKDARESLRALAPLEFVDKIEVTYTSVNPEEISEVLLGEFDRDALFRKFALPENKFTVICVGQFIDRKGRWTFLEAAQKLLNASEDILFVWVSNSKPSAEERTRVESFGLGDNFRLITNDQVGSERRDLLHMYLLGDVFVLPSFVEGLPIALLEAMALGIPSVSTNVNGIPEAIVHLETGLLIEPGDSAGLAEAILTLKGDPELGRKIGDAGREKVLREFDERDAAKIAWESYIEAFIK